MRHLILAAILLTSTAAVAQDAPATPPAATPPAATPPAATPPAETKPEPTTETLTFVLDGSLAQHQKAMDAAIEDAIDDMNFITRPIARSKLKKSNTIFKTVGLVLEPDTVSIKLDARKPTKTKSDGKTSVNWTRDDGDEFKITQKREQNSITQVYHGEDGSKTIVYNLSSDHKKLTMIVQVKSPSLPKPLTYTLRYKAK